MKIPKARRIVTDLAIFTARSSDCLWKTICNNFICATSQDNYESTARAAFIFTAPVWSGGRSRGAWVTRFSSNITNRKEIKCKFYIATRTEIEI